MDPLSISASIIAVLGATIKVLELCKAYSETVNNASKELLRIIEEVESLRSVLTTLQQLAEKAESKDAVAESRLPTLKVLSDPDKGELVKCRSELEALIQNLNPPSLNGQAPSKRKAVMRALGWPLKEKETRTTLEKIERF
jgi:sulfite reductase alpha subunit-like flavoprotein